MRDRPSRDIVLMMHAHVAALRSTCSRLQVGCVFALEGRILVTGYNGAPAGMPHCDHSCDCDSPADLVPIVHRIGCRSEKPCKLAVHDVANAIAFAAQHGVRLGGAEVYTTDTPCLGCAQLLINAGVGHVFADRDYRLTEGVELLEARGIPVTRIPMPATLYLP